jgi:hypothetical protein
MRNTDRDDRSKELGVNSYATPEVGEGLGTFSVGERIGGGIVNYSVEEANAHYKDSLDQVISGGVPGDFDSTRDSLDNLIRMAGGAVANLDEYFKKGVWQGHFAGVVARSGEDYVTLENYNRQRFMMWEVERIVKNLYENVGAFSNFVNTTYDRTKNKRHVDRTTQDLRLAIREGRGLAQEIQDAEDSINALVRDLNQNGNKRWYFGMFGPARQLLPGGQIVDQSFHQAMVNIGDFANPVTLRLRARKTTEQWDFMAQKVNVEATKDNYTQLGPLPGNEDEIRTQEQRLVEVLAYAQKHLNAKGAGKRGRRGRVTAMRQKIGQIVTQNGPNKDLAVYVQARINNVGKGIFIR